MRILGLGRTGRRLVLAILITAFIPVLTTMVLGRTIVRRISAIAFQPEFGVALDQALGVYQDLTRAIKQGMRAEAEAIAAAEPLRAAAIIGHRPSIEQQLELAIATHPSLVSIQVHDENGELLGERNRGRPVDEATERVLTVQRPLGPAEPSPAAAGAVDSRPVLTAVFATDRARFDEMAGATEFAQAYRQMEGRHRAGFLERTYAGALAAILGFTIVISVAAGVLLAGPVTRRIGRLALATKAVAAGDLSVRVRDRRRDEIGDLARAFDTMLGEMEESRARIEFLRRIGAWQEMARRLAHEIKNPLTPIQLAVQECHRRYDGDDAAYKAVLQTTLEVVEEEVGTLRRLVGEFSNFARLPHADLGEADLADFLREQAGRLTAPAGPAEQDGSTSTERGGDSARAWVDRSDEPLGPSGRSARPELFDRSAGGMESQLPAGIDLRFDIPKGAMPAVIDREMLHRVLLNLVRNAAEAIEGARISSIGGGRGHTEGTVQVRLSQDRSTYIIDVEDDGPGVPADLRAEIFDPYVTTKGGGTGLGLSIVKKIVVDHGGTIDVDPSPLGGARFRLRLPRAGTPGAIAAVERAAQAAAQSGVPPSLHGESLRAG